MVLHAHRADVVRFAPHNAEIQALNAEGDYFSNGHDKAVYEAVLWAAPDLPDKVAAICLELAERRDLNSDIRRRASRQGAGMQANAASRGWWQAPSDQALPDDMTISGTAQEGQTLNEVDLVRRRIEVVDRATDR